MWTACEPFQLQHLLLEMPLPLLFHIQVLWPRPEDDSFNNKKFTTTIQVNGCNQGTSIHERTNIGRGLQGICQPSPEVATHIFDQELWCPGTSSMQTSISQTLLLKRMNGLWVLESWELTAERLSFNLHWTNNQQTKQHKCFAAQMLCCMSALQHKCFAAQLCCWTTALLHNCFAAQAH